MGDQEQTPQEQDPEDANGGRRQKSREVTARES